MKKIRLTEEQLHKVIKESVNRILKESNGQSLLEKVQIMIDALNNSYNELSAEYGDNEPCMDKDGHCYGFSKPVMIKKNGYIYFPFNKDAYGEYEPLQIRTFTKSNGKISYYKDDIHYEEDYRDALKLIKTIISDIERGKKHLEGYDPNWEDEDNVNGKQHIKQFNKQIGIRNN